MRLLAIVMVTAMMLFAAQECAAAGIVNGNHQDNSGWGSGGVGHPNHRPPGYSGQAGDPPSNRGARIGRTFGAGGVRGWTGGIWFQVFDCRLEGQEHPNRWCVVTFRANYDGGTEGEVARVSFLNGKTKVVAAAGIPAAGGWAGYTISVKGCQYPMQITFDIIDDPKKNGIDARLLIDNVASSCQVDSPTNSGGLEELSQGHIPTVTELLDHGCAHNGLFDCNENGQPDDDDLFNGFSVDSNGNGIPDECEAAATGACIGPDGTCTDEVTEAACEQSCGHYFGDGSTCSAIPTLTEWGLIIFGVVLLGFITWVFLKRRRVAGVRV